MVVRVRVIGVGNIGVDHVRRLTQRVSGVDIDVLDPSAAPGTGTPEPPGISSAVPFDVLCSLKELEMVALDVNEILPEVDPANITAITGAKLIREATLLLARGASPGVERRP